MFGLNLVEPKDRMNVFRRFLYYFMLFLSISIILLVGVLLNRRNQMCHESYLQASVQVGHYRGLIGNRFSSVHADLNFLPELNEVIRYKEYPNERDLEFIANEFLEFSRSRGIYDQIRYLDMSGQEIVRVNYNKGRPSIVPQGKLQNKKNRYYFQESVGLDRNEIYMSPLDLNKENGVIETPYKPMIRFATGIFNNEGQKSGVLILNYLADEFIRDLRNATQNNPGVFALLNSDGYWLYANDPDREWGFLFPDGGTKSLILKDNTLWRMISEREKNQFEYNNMMYTVMEVEPFSGENDIIGQPRWFLVNMVPAEAAGTSWGDFAANLLRYSLIIAVVIGFLAWLMANIEHQRNLYKNALEHSALYDSLTNLPNRNYLRTRGEQLIRELKRYHQAFALLYIDLDDFKTVNDTMGHEAGDQLLVQVAHRLKSCVRSSDTVARIGGDEFIALIQQVKKSEDAETVAGNILEELKQDFLLEQGTARIGGSIGIVIADNADEEGLHLDTLMNRADKAMYGVKKSGKNRYALI